MKAAGIAGGLLGAASAVAGLADERPRFDASAGAGLSPGGNGTHFVAGLGYSLIRHLSLGVELGYSRFPAPPNRVGGRNSALFGLATLRAHVLPSATVSPYALVGYGAGRHRAPTGEKEWGRASMLGAGTDVRLHRRTSLFLDARLAVIEGIVAADGAHIESAIRIGVRLRF